MSIHIGTSGWHYKDWVGRFYPEAFRSEKMLGYYAKEFGAVEINNSFYQLPDPKTLKAWRDSTPDGFVFAFKASRYITHMKKLRDAGDALENTVAAARTLGDKLGPILFQLPPRWRVDADRLREFLELIPDDLKVGFEFRAASWFVEDVYRLLREHRAAFCIYHLEGQWSPSRVTADFVYVRLHGPDGAYKGSYTIQDLSGWAGAISAWDRGGKDVYCFFDNDERAYAADNARELRDLLGGI